VSLVFIACIAAVPTACKKTPSETDAALQRQKSELSDIYELYRDYSKRNQQPPKQLSDLNKKDFQSLYPIALQALQKGDYIAVWGVSGKDASTLLAYHKDVPTKGGTVVMADGTQKNMSADEFKAAKQ
jgi:hypothetical protein